MNRSSAPVQLDWAVSAADWMSDLARCPGGTFFHTAGWLSAMEAAFGSRPTRVKAHMGDGRWALLPLSVRSLAKGRVPLALGGETGAYGGLVSPEPLTAAESERIYAAVRKRIGSWRLTGNPFEAGRHLPEGGSAGETHLLALAPFETLRAGFSRGCKARGNKARKSGLRLEIRTDADAAKAYYGLYLDTVARWGDRLTWARPERFFTGILAHGAPHARLFLAYQDGLLVSGLLFGAYGQTAHYIAGATLASHLELAPSNFLMEEALRHYAEAGFAHFDFGPSNGLEGVMRFKESFGAKPAPLGSSELTSPAARTYFALLSARERLEGFRPGEGDTPAPSPLPAPRLSH